MPVWSMSSIYLSPKRFYTPLRFGKDFGTKQKRYAGYHELAYLHPRRFVPDPNVLKEFGFQETDSFFVVRLVAWKASHDLGQHGFQPGEANELIALPQEKGKVIVSSEATGKTELAGQQLEIHPSKMHDLLYYATLCVGEGGTMATEAGILGTPSIFVSSLTASNWTELEQDYGLMYSHADGSSALKRIRDLLATKDLKTAWQLKRERLLKEKIDVCTGSDREPFYRTRF